MVTTLGEINEVLNDNRLTKEETRDMLYQDLLHCPHLYWNLSQDLKDVCDYDMMLKILKKNGNALSWFAYDLHKKSNEKQFFKACLAAVRQNGNALGTCLNYFIEDTEKRDIIIRCALRQNGMALHRIMGKDWILNEHPEYLFDAVKSNGLALQHMLYFLIHKRIIDDEVYFELCKIAIQQNYRALYHALNTTNELINLAIEKNGLAIRYLCYPTEELQLKAIRRNLNAFRYIHNPTSTVIAEHDRLRSNQKKNHNGRA